MALQFKRAPSAFRQFPVLDAQAITLFAVVKLSGGNVVPVTAAGDDVLGMAAEQKVASDGRVLLGVYLPESREQFVGTLDAPTTIARGDLLAFSSAGVVTKSATNPFAYAVNAGTSLTTVQFALLGDIGQAAQSITVATITATSPGSGADGSTPNGAQWTAGVADLTALRAEVLALTAALKLATP